MHKIKILIAEPDSITARNLKNMLPSLGLGYTVTSIVSTGEDAIRQARKDTPDLLLLGIALSGKLNGIQTGRRIRALYDIPIIYVTTHSDEKTLQKAKLVKPNGFILKPIDERELRIAIEIALCTHAKVKKTEKALRESEKRFRQLSRHLHFARERESKRIAREIHDELGQALTTLKIGFSWLSQSFPGSPKDQERILNKIKSMSELADETILKVQRISSELRPIVLDELGLLPAIKWLAQDFQNRTKIRCRVNLESFDFEFEPERSIALFRIMQEALTNVARHSQATRVSVNLRKKKRNLELKIRDNGIGIKESDILSSDSLGIIGMRERIIPFGANFKLQGIPARGTTLSIVLPIERMKRA